MVRVTGHRSEVRGFYHRLMTPSNACVLLPVSLQAQPERQHSFRDHLHYGGSREANG